MREFRGNTSVAYQMESQPKVTTQEKRLPQTGLPPGEKILYLVSVIICVALASWVLSRSAAVAETNLKLQEVERRAAEVEEANKADRERIHGLKSGERIRRYAEENGMVRMEKKPPDTSEKGKRKTPIRSDERG